MLNEALGVELEPSLLQLALTHRSFAYESISKESNERLEFLGDSVLGLIVTEELYKRYPDFPESRLSPLRAGVVNMYALADIARTLNIGQHMRLGKGEEVNNGRDKNSLLADALEAIFGAIYLQYGFEKCAEIVRRLTAETMDSAVARGAGDGKTALQELAASLGKGAPEYVVTQEGPDHDKNFTAVAMVAGAALATGTGKSKREAEQIAARMAYESLKTDLPEQ